MIARDVSRFEQLKQIAAEPRIGQKYYQAIVQYTAPIIENNKRTLLSLKNSPKQFAEDYIKLVSHIEQNTQGLNEEEKALKLREILRPVSRDIERVGRDFRNLHYFEGSAYANQGGDYLIVPASFYSPAVQRGFEKRLWVYFVHPPYIGSPSRLLPLCVVGKVDFNIDLLVHILGDDKVKPIEMNCLKQNSWDDTFIIGMFVQPGIAVDKKNRRIEVSWVTDSEPCGRDPSDRGSCATARYPSTKEIMTAIKGL